MLRLTRRLAVSVLLATCPLPAVTQGVTALRAGRLVDVERGEVRRDQLVIIRDGRIQSVQPASVGPPEGSRVIDLSGYIVLPGLIDCHTLLIGEPSGAEVLYPLQRSEAQEAFSGFVMHGPPCWPALRQCATWAHIGRWSMSHCEKRSKTGP